MHTILVCNRFKLMGNVSIAVEVMPWYPVCFIDQHYSKAYSHVLWPM